MVALAIGDMVEPVGVMPWQPKGPKVNDKGWEAKQRAKEYRVALRREKRNRKADEKKQRKLNATILRRMTRNPEKYYKNHQRNRGREIELERRRIRANAIRQIQDIAVDHDPSGVTFNVAPVLRLEDGRVVTQESVQRREERIANKSNEAQVLDGSAAGAKCTALGKTDSQEVKKGVSKRQLKKQELDAPRPAPPKPILPEGLSFSLPPGEEDWLALWDISDEALEHRIKSVKTGKAKDRKALRRKQQAGKEERRAARDEKRRVYRDIKLEWKTIKGETSKRKQIYKAIENEEARRIAVMVNEYDRRMALEICASLGFTIENTEGTADIKPKAMGMKGVVVDFDKIEKADKYGDIRLKTPSTKPSSKRVDLSGIAGDQHATYIGGVSTADHDQDAVNNDDFMQLDIGEEEAEHKVLELNHRTRRKLRRALDNVDVKKELLVRERAIAHFKDQGMEVPPQLQTRSKPKSQRGHRIMETGKLETEKQERVRKRVELTEFNNYMKILRRQAKASAVFAGLKKHAELTGKIPVSEAPTVQTSTLTSLSATNGLANGVRIQKISISNTESDTTEEEGNDDDDDEEDDSDDDESGDEDISAIDSDSDLLSSSDSDTRRRKKRRKTG